MVRQGWVPYIGFPLLQTQTEGEVCLGDTDSRVQHSRHKTRTVAANTGKDNLNMLVAALLRGLLHDLQRGRENKSGLTCHGFLYRSILEAMASMMSCCRWIRCSPRSICLMYFSP